MNGREHMGGGARRASWASFAALGDSFTEGIADPAPGGGFRGWADRLAEHLTTREPELRYANLAVRGKLLRQIVETQVPQALELRPALVSLVGGGNDIIRPGGDPDQLAAIFDDAVTRLRATGADVLIGTGFDTSTTPVLRRVRGKVGTYNAHLRAIADKHGCFVVDLWSMRVLKDQRAWSEDRLHLSAEGHRRVALRACEALGVAVDQDWRAPWPELPTRPWRVQRAEDIQWAREHLAPWIVRRLRGRSSGDGRGPKRPSLELVCTAGAQNSAAARNSSTAEESGKC
ncbi:MULTISPECIES: SGNH/GDSL hydrolase family protein [unclassified Saccharopolyspora]|uniref:SGNH/GDSL hydrolase family protein n=1 Tax=unclassified Saccharopolyspora TaxID=2646250 RepID=UPI001CD364F5|nr:MULTISPECIES: SGNH/GDSL hydrolase family protein [unclassified Saccharopolyspora]MCA1189981.1 SGNH/GDSL hydrolase family protein [Saccharopolyspora sp. 6T]MCA1194759.1 SGNH/GDSL hydrolase family protein [Saccharopolyspora sp. 6V]MCA1228511.1 SGNH/GDSL hydrolase family protein [Saccharopolyspora sp. 6M]MCA1283366.1 SGNH/GDSL hydrolase family protein [Saccharopolyspora sp. 7B]